MSSADRCYDCGRDIVGNAIERQDVAVGSTYLPPDGSPGSHGRYAKHYGRVSLCPRCASWRNMKTGCVAIVIAIPIVSCLIGNLFSEKDTVDASKPSVADLRPESQDSASRSERAGSGGSRPIPSSSQPGTGEVVIKLAGKKPFDGIAYVEVDGKAAINWIATAPDVTFRAPTGKRHVVVRWKAQGKYYMLDFGSVEVRSDKPVVLTDAKVAIDAGAKW